MIMIINNFRTLILFYVRTIVLLLLLLLCVTGVVTIVRPAISRPQRWSSAVAYYHIIVYRGVYHYVILYYM
jgi:hypothetical protein